MNCPKCDTTFTNVLESRRRTYVRGRGYKSRFDHVLGHQQVKGLVRRRRECPDCGHRWITLELSLDMLDKALTIWQRTVMAYMDH